MRHLCFALLVVSSASSVVEAQVSARDAATINRAIIQQQDQKQLQDRWKKSGEQLFGTPTVELRDGTLHKKQPAEWQVGDWGFSEVAMKTMDVVNSKEVLVSANGGRLVFLIRGVSTTKIADDMMFIFAHPFSIDETYTYDTVAGGEKRVLVLDVSKYPARLEAFKTAEEEALYRTWTVAGKEVVAKYTSFESGKVTLTLKDHTVSVVSIADLSKDDKAVIAKERKLSAAAKAEAEKEERAHKAKGSNKK